MRLYVFVHKQAYSSTRPSPTPRRPTSLHRLLPRRPALPHRLTVPLAGLWPPSAVCYSRSGQRRRGTSRRRGFGVVSAVGGASLPPRALHAAVLDEGGGRSSDAEGAVISRDWKQRAGCANTTSSSSRTSSTTLIQTCWYALVPFLPQSMDYESHSHC